jgi:hypothetical protein
MDQAKAFQDVGKDVLGSGENIDLCAIKIDAGIRLGTGKASGSDMLFSLCRFCAAARDHP